MISNDIRILSSILLRLISNTQSVFFKLGKTRNYSYNFLMTSTQDDSQISLRIATAAAGITAIGFLSYAVIINRLSSVTIPIF